MLGMDDTHKKAHIGAIVVTWITFVLVVIFTYISHGPLPDTGVFKNSTQEVFEEYSTSLSPTEPTYLIVWTIVFLWMLVALCYGCTTIVRYTSYGYLYIAPGHIRWNIYIMLVIAMGLHLVWLFVIDTQNIVWVFILSLGATMVLCIDLTVALRRMYRRGLVLQREEASIEIWLCRLALHNALDAYATWFYYLTLLSLNAELVHNFSVVEHLSGTAIMGCLLFSIVFYFCFDIFTLDKYTRYCFSGYVIIIISLFGSVINNWNGLSSLTILTTLTLVVSCLALTFKVAILVYRHHKEPVWTGTTMFLANTSGRNREESHNSPYYGSFGRTREGSNNSAYSSDNTGIY